MSDSAFKNFISPSVVKTLADQIALVHPSFPKVEFMKVSEGLGPLELKARVLLITEALRVHLPQDYLKALKILHKVIENDKVHGFSLWPFSEYIGQFGLGHFDESLITMKAMTERFTSEFAIRPFFIKNPQKVLKQFKVWSKDKNHHVRRWVSEGSRPLLPWGQRLDLFKREPAHTLELLDVLKFDEELYVRKSVANHLNDISKHHPDVVIATLSRWQKECPEKHQAKLDWIRRHALRTLIKKGNSKALKLMGVGGEAKVSVGNIKLAKDKLKVGEVLSFSFDLRSMSNKKQKIVVDYAIHFLKKNGQSVGKVFKLKTFELTAKESVQIKKNHSFKKITTMVYYPGVHKVAVQINGKPVKDAKFSLKV